MIREILIASDGTFKIMDTDATEDRHASGLAKLSDDALRVKVAVLCGWERIERHDGLEKYAYQMPNCPEQLVWAEDLPNYLSDLNAALTLCDVLADKGFVCRLDNGLDKTWECVFYDLTNKQRSFYAPADKLPRAISEAFVLTLEQSPDIASSRGISVSSK